MSEHTALNRREFVLSLAVIGVPILSGADVLAYTTHEGGDWIDKAAFESMTEDERWRLVPLRYKVSKRGVAPPAAIKYTDGQIFDRIIATHYPEITPWRFQKV